MASLWIRPSLLSGGESLDLNPRRIRLMAMLLHAGLQFFGVDLLVGAVEYSRRILDTQLERSGFVSGPSQ